MRRWHGILCVGGAQLGASRRVLESFVWSNLPRTLRAQLEDVGWGHAGAKPAGLIETLEVLDGSDARDLAAELDVTLPEGWTSVLYGTGRISDGEFGREVAGLIDEGVLTDISVDPGEDTVVVQEVIDENGDVVDGDTLAEKEVEFWDAIDNDDQGRAAEIEIWFDSLTWRDRFDPYDLNAATLLAVPAFTAARIVLLPADVEGDDQGDGQETAAGSPMAALVARAPSVHRGNVERPQFAGSGLPTQFTASAGPAPRRAEWYQAAKFSAPTKWTVTDGGRMMGHLFTWGACHRSWEASACRTPDFMRGENFRKFHVGETRLDNGRRIRTGALTFNARHALHRLGMTDEEIAEQCENTGLQLGTVRLFVDEFGVQACGQVHDSVTADQVAQAIGGFPSYDARTLRGAKRLYGLHVVNVPGHAFEDDTMQVTASGTAGTFELVDPTVFLVDSRTTPPVAEGCTCGGVEACSCEPARMSTGSMAALAEADRAMRTART